MQENNRDISILKGRILQYLKLKGITKYAFYKETGATNGILSQSNGLSEENLLRFLSYYKDVNPIWLLTGEGNIFNTKITENVTLSNGDKLGDAEGDIRKLRKTSPFGTDILIPEQMVPVYESMMLQTLGPLFADKLKPSSYLSLPNLPKCDGAVRMWSDTMMPELQGGDLLVFKKVKDLRTGLFLGQIYLLSIELEGEEYVMVQYVEQSDESESVKLVSKNERYPPKDIPLSAIKALAMIKASVRYRSV